MATLLPRILFKTLLWTLGTGFLLIIAFSSPVYAAKPTWIEKSDALAREYALDLATIFPEQASDMGYREFDSKAMKIVDDLEAVQLEQARKWQTNLKKAISEEKDSEVRVDLQILQTKVERQIEGLELDLKYSDVPHQPLSQTVFESLQTLINPQTDTSRKSAAVDRFKVYVNGTAGQKPLADAFQSRISSKIKKAQEAGLWPLKEEIEKYLADSKSYVDGVKELLEESGRTDWKADHEKFSRQVVAYDSFVKEKILPKARTDYRLPSEIYAYILKMRGIEATPEQLIETGLKDYKTVYAQFRETARKIARKLKLKQNDPVVVLAHLKKQQVTKVQDVRRLYDEADTALATIIRKHDLVSMPEAPLKIRFAGDAESKAAPVPHLKPPPLVNNKGERPEFVVPTSSSGQLPFDDFTYKATAYVLTAHEGRPGHDLQFSTMLDKGVSLIRARYAMNNVNAEGWGLYAEDMVFQYLPEEAQLAALQTRLWRIARMYLDPQIQLGKVKPDRVIEVFTKELGVSRAMAELELQRYTFKDVGQAPSYYHGLKLILGFKERLRSKPGVNFREKCFNDAVLGMGLMPLELIGERLEGDLKCTTTAKISSESVR